MPKEKIKICKNHGETLFTLEGRGYYRCKKCRSLGVSNRRRRVKQILIDQFGGKCYICGYNKYNGALDFHHISPDKKLFNLSLRGLTKGIKTIIEEAKKCVLLCSNCHREVEGKFTKL